MIRKIILAVLGIVILGLSARVMTNLMNSEKEKATTPNEKQTKVFVTSAENQDVQVEVKLTGRLEAVDKITIFSETQGVFRSPKAFRPGSYFKKGETIISVDGTQEMATLKAQRSNLVNQVVCLLPDLKFDYPEAFEKWEAYVSSFDVDATTPRLPKADSEREKFFIAGQNISTTYYNIKNLEARLSKYRIRAPFSGVLTQTFVQPGALISPGQQLAVLTGQYNFELPLPVREEYVSLLKVGQTLNLMATESGESYEGKLVRINPVVDPSSQSIMAYVQVRGKGLTEGMFLEAMLPLEPYPNAIQIDRKLLVANKYVFGVENDSLFKIDVQPLHYGENTVVVSGVPEETLILDRLLPGAREGMKVEIIK